jgi:hypothetical protein
MNITTVYKCEICGAEYNTQEACEKCEKMHKTEYKNANLDKFSRMKSYPDSITVQFKDDPDDQFVVYSYRNRYSYKNHKEDNNNDVEPIYEEIDNE